VLLVLVLVVRCPWQQNVLGPVPGVDVMAKRPQGLLNVGDSFRADGGAAFLRSCHLAPCASRFSLAIYLLFSNFPLATTTISSLTTCSKSPPRRPPPPPHFPFFFEQQCRLFRSKREAQEKVSDFFETPAVGFLEPY
jgi:hypothetical protein